MKRVSTIIVSLLLGGMGAPYPPASDAAESLETFNYTETAFDGNNLWCATSGGVIKWDLETMSYERFSAVDGVADNDVLAVAVAPDGKIWAGTHFDGVSCYDGESWTTYTVGDGLSDNYIFSIAFDSGGGVWFGTKEGGVCRFDGEAWTTYTAEDGLGDNFVPEIYIDENDVLWCGTVTRGVSRFDGESWTTVINDAFGGDMWVRCFAFDREGVLWCGTWGEGVCRFDGETWTTYTTEDGLGSNHVYTIDTDAEGRVWCGTWGGGVCRFDGETWSTFTKADGLPYNHIEDVSIGPDGTVWCGTAGGLSFYDNGRWILLTPGKHIIVTAPNGGERYTMWQPGTVSWRAFGIETVAVEYTTDNGAAWTLVGSGIDAREGSMTWRTPGIESDACLIRVSSSDDRSIYDTSDGLFTIAPPEPGMMHFTPDTFNTGGNAVLLIPAGIPVSIAGESLEPGDEIGVFSPGGICCGAGNWEGVSLAVTVWGDDSQTGEIDGFLEGEPLVLKVWDVSAGREYVARAAFENSDGKYRSDGVYVAAGLETETIEYTLRLEKGWNTISFPVMPADSDVESVFGETGDNLVLVKNGKGEVYWPSYSIDQIGVVTITGGYRVYMNRGDEITVRGTEIYSPDVRYRLRPGWNLIGYTGVDGLAPSAAFEPILASLVIVKDGLGNVFWPVYGVDDLGALYRGEGYWVNVTGHATFSFPHGQAVKTISGRRTAGGIRHFGPVSGTGANATLLLKADVRNPDSGITLTDGDEVGVFSPAGLCAGAGVWEGGRPCVITLWGDDPMTGAVDGLVEGESFTLAQWDAETGRVSRGISFDADDARYSANGIITGTLSGGAGATSVGPDGFRLFQNAPNPFNPATSISFDLPRACAVKLTIYTATGETVATLVDGVLTPGVHTVTWNALGLGSGIYFCRIDAGGFTDTKKLVLIR